MTPSPYSLSLLKRIQKKNKRHPVTVDSLMEGRSWRATSKIVDAIKELREEGMLTCVSILDHGKFATEIAGFEGWRAKGSVGTKVVASDEPTDLASAGPNGLATVVPKSRKYKKRTVKRSLI